MNKHRQLSSYYFLLFSPFINKLASTFTDLFKCKKTPQQNEKRTRSKYYSRSKCQIRMHFGFIHIQLLSKWGKSIQGARWNKEIMLSRFRYDVCEKWKESREVEYLHNVLHHLIAITGLINSTIPDCLQLRPLTLGEVEIESVVKFF